MSTSQWNSMVLGTHLLSHVTSVYMRRHGQNGWLKSGRPEFESPTLLWRLAGWTWASHTLSAYFTSQGYYEDKIGGGEENNANCFGSLLGRKAECKWIKYGMAKLKFRVAMIRWTAKDCSCTGSKRSDLGRSDPNYFKPEAAVLTADGCFHCCECSRSIPPDVQTAERAVPFLAWSFPGLQQPKCICQMCLSGWALHTSGLRPHQGWSFWALWPGPVSHN